MIKCSFCKKILDEVKRMFAGPRAYICIDCVSKFYEADLCMVDKPSTKKE